MMEILPSFQVDIKVEEKQDPREGKEEEVKIEFISLVLFECFPTISMHASHKCKKE